MIGIDISDKSIKFVQLASDATRRLLARGFKALPDGLMENGLVLQPKQVSKILEEIFRECDVSLQIRDAVVASIPETQSFLRVIEIPTMHEDEVSEAIQWEIAQHIPFGLDNVYIDWQPLDKGHKPTTGRQEVQVGATQKKVVDGLLQVLSALHLDVAAFELESQAIVRSLISQELRDRQGLLIVDLGASATNVVIHDHGAMRFTASLQKGAQNLRKSLPTHIVQALDVSSAQGKPSALQADLLNALRPAMEELIMEIRGIVEFYNSIDQQHEVQEIILCGGGSNLPGLDTLFPKYFENVHVQRGNPWVNIVSNQKDVRAPLDIQESVRYTTALGLALRPVLI